MFHRKCVKIFLYELLKVFLVLDKKLKKDNKCQQPGSRTGSVPSDKKSVFILSLMPRLAKKGRFAMVSDYDRGLIMSVLDVQM